MRRKWKILLAVLIVLALGLYYYIALPAINIHSVNLWAFVIVVLALAAVVYSRVRHLGRYDWKASKGLKGILLVLAAVILCFIVGAILSSTLVNAKKYASLLDVEDAEFTTDIEEVSYDQIPLLDKDSAELLGDRKMGSIVDMVSQFEVDDLYSQINYQDEPVRVSPLKYASIIKWFTNMSDGIPGYIRIDMATQDTELVRLDEGMKYTTSDHFGRYIYRHLRFKYPTYIFNELSFEIDEDGTPWWVCPVIKYNVGLFGGETIGRVVLCNAITGETVDYAVEDVPEWVDRVYSADLLVELYDYYGTLRNGFWNSILGQKDCLNTTSGYNYLAIDDDVWVYTGVTSITADESNVGFVLMNQRTMETRFYEVEGATETSAMSSAEGQVQNLEYEATFPLLLNISGQPTYFICLKDDAGLVKKYAMVNIQKYQIVAIGDTVSECEESYSELMVTNGINTVDDEEDEADIETLTGKITKIAQGVVDGNSHYYIMLDGSDEIFDVSVVDYIDIIRYDVGDTVTIEYEAGDETCTVLSLAAGEEDTADSEDTAESDDAEDTAAQAEDTEDSSDAVNTAAQEEDTENSVDVDDSTAEEAADSADSAESTAEDSADAVESTADSAESAADDGNTAESDDASDGTEESSSADESYSTE